MISEDVITEIGFLKSPFFGGQEKIVMFPMLFPLEQISLVFGSDVCAKRIRRFRKKESSERWAKGHFL